MNLKLNDDYIDEGITYGPLPNFNGSFEMFFIEKAANLIYKSNYNNHFTNTQLIVSIYEMN
jgi:hypothetical protein